MFAITLSDFSFIGTANAQAAGGNPVMGFLPIILIFIVIYFFMIRPQNKRAKDHADMVAALKKGDKVIGAGGLFGTVSKIVDDHQLEVELAKDVTVSMVKSSVSQVMTKPTLSAKAAESSETVTKTIKKTVAKKKAPARKPAVKTKAASKTAKKAVKK